MHDEGIGSSESTRARIVGRVSIGGALAGR
jgi:hypothetical protein